MVPNFNIIKINSSQNLNKEGSYLSFFVSLCQPSTKTQVTESLKKAEHKSSCYTCTSVAVYIHTSSACNRVSVKPLRLGERGNTTAF